MRTKKIFSFDEKKDAEEILRNGFKDNTIDYSKMYVIAKYFKDEFGYGEKRLEKKLIDFCLEHDKNFNPIVDSDIIKSWVKSAMMYSLRKIDKLDLHQEEIEFLKKVNTNRERKLLFSILIMAKALKHRDTRRDRSKKNPSDKYYIHYNSFMDIIRLSKMQGITEIGLASVIHKYIEHFTLYNPEKQLLRVNYVHNTGVVLETITEFDNIMSYYDKYLQTKGENMTALIIGYCARCKKEIEKKSNRQKYCKDCAKDVYREKQKETMRNRRENE